MYLDLVLERVEKTGNHFFFLIFIMWLGVAKITTVFFFCQLKPILVLIYQTCISCYSKATVTHHAKKDLMGIMKSINPGQPVQSGQADHSQNFSLWADFLCIISENST